MIRIAVVDDEEAFVSKIKNQLSEYLKIQSITHQICTYTDPVKFISENSENVFDLIYLDIDMPDMNGIELASKIRDKESETSIVFVSSHSNFVFETFQYSPYRFIRKEKIEAELTESIKSYVNNIYKKKQYIKFQLANKDTYSVYITKVVYLFSLRHNVIFVNEAGETMQLANRSYTMDELEEKLEYFGFIRIHKSYLVNYRYIYQILGNEAILLPLNNNKSERLPLSARRVVDIKQKFQKLIRGGNLL